MSDTEPNTWIKPLLSGLIGTAFGVMVTYSTGVASNRTEIVRLATKVDNLTTTIQDSMADRYRGADAVRDFGIIREQIIEIKAHDAALDSELRTHLKSHDK